VKKKNSISKGGKRLFRSAQKFGEQKFEGWK